MKKLLFSMLAVLLMNTRVAAQTFSVEDVEMLAGTTSVTFALHVSGSEAMTSMHFELSDPSGKFTISSASATAAWPSAIFSSGSEAVSAMCTSDKAFTGDGDFASIVLAVAEDIELGTYPITLVSSRVNGVNIDNSTFNVNVTNRVVLDEDATTAPAVSDGAVNVRVKRTIAAGNWSTIVLPFAMTEAQVTEAFGSDVKLADFTGVQTTVDEDDNIVSMKVSFRQAAAMEANHPYLIRVGEDISEFTVDGVTVSPEEEPSVDRDEQSVKVGKITYTSYNRLVGTYVAGTVIEEQMLFLNGNKFYYSDGTVVMKGYRAYFDFYDVLPEVEDAGVKMFLDIDGEQTRIGEIVDGKSLNGQWLDLSGRRVGQARKGLYIIDGKKVLVK